MFDPEYYPSSQAAWEAMNVDCYGKRVLDPSAGSGTLLQYCAEAGAESVQGIEKHPELRRLLSTKFPVIGDDWFNVTAEQISHVDMIIMNPPYSNADKHILHAWAIAPEGCEIVAQCNAETIDNPYVRSRNELKSLIVSNGSAETFEGLYKQAERTTDVKVSVVRLFKPMSLNNPEYDGFYFDMDEEPDATGVIRYNEIRALVNTYTAAIRCFDRFAEVGKELNNIAELAKFGTGYSGYCFRTNSSDKGNAIVRKEDFAAEFQKHLWRQVFMKFNLEKYLTQGVMRDVNKFVESRQNYPFTMRNIFRMVEIIIGTSEHNMNRAIVEAVDKFTQHTDENRFGVEGWKTNAGHMLNKKFIVGYICESAYSWQSDRRLRIDRTRGNMAHIEDLCRAICNITGQDFNRLTPIGEASLPAEEQSRLREYREEIERETGKYNRIAISGTFGPCYNRFEPNTWYTWGFFRFKVYRKGTGHFEFLNEDVWARLNQAYAEAKGVRLPEKTWDKTKPKKRKAA